MANRAIPLRVGDVELLVEAVPVAGSEQTSTKLARAQDTITEAFDRAQAAIMAIASSTMTTIGQLSQRSTRPNEVQVKFGLRFSAQGNVIVAGASGEATLEVTLTYQTDFRGRNEDEG